MKSQAPAKKPRVVSIASVLLKPAVWLERAQGRRRLGLACVYIVIVCASGFLLWWANSLNGLPDIGTPFDEGPLQRASVPDEQNAFVLYRQAVEQLVPLDREYYPLARINLPWSQVAPEIRNWLTTNREALRLWQEGAERPLALYIPPSQLTFETRMPVVQKLRDLMRLADLEGARLEDAGDLPGAWRVYRALLRSSRHVGMYGCAIQRIVGAAGARTAAPRIIAWSDDPRVGAQELRVALAEVNACEAMTPPASQAIQIEFLSMMKAFNKPKRWMHGDRNEAQYWYQHMPGAPETELFLAREPERSRRVAQLVFANWLAYCDRPAGQRRSTQTEMQLYDCDATAPAQARALPIDALERWTATTLLARHVVPGVASLLRSVDGERGALSGVKVHLAGQLYLREHGRPAQKLSDLVGPYLERLPEGYEDPEIPLGDPPGERASSRAP